MTVRFVEGASQSAPARASVTVTSADDDDDSGDDDDSAPGDDDDSAAGDDDDSSPGDDDDSTSPPIDQDGDGWPSDLDCDDTDPTVHPGATESCDEVDSNCDEDLVDGFADTDGDTLPDCVDDDDDGDGYADGVDCDPLNALMYPNAPESCDLIDSDCDGDLVDGEPDLDGDGIPDCADDDADGDGVGVASGDCDDFDSNVFPGQSAFFTAPAQSGGYDYDCDGVETTELTALAVGSPTCPGYSNCSVNCYWSAGWVCYTGGLVVSCNMVSGWTVPTCGASHGYAPASPLSTDCPLTWLSPGSPAPPQAQACR